VKEEVEKLTCDNCKREELVKKGGFGSGTSLNWYKVSCTRQSVVNRKGPWDFCTVKCMIEFFKDRVN